MEIVGYCFTYHSVQRLILSRIFHRQNKSITLSDFKTIYYWEWSHRIIGRLIGLTFLAPIPYFLLRRRLSPKATLSLLGIGTLIGCQGAMGWYMVKSGLDEVAVKEMGGVPRVSQYRLAAHLGLAFLVYTSCVRLSLGVGRDWRLVNGGIMKLGKGLGGTETVQKTLELLSNKIAGKTRVLVSATTGLIFVTAISGSFPFLVFCLVS
jgi:cytochrome c oxidase assembly protein subunit 15